MSDESSTNMSASELEWVHVKEVIESRRNQNEETFIEKGKRKMKQNPLVPIGCVATASCLIYGLFSLSRGDSKTQQMMMKGRVMAQGFTICAMAVGIVATFAFPNDKNHKTKE